MNDSLNKNLEQLTNDILASYTTLDSTQRIGETFLPTRSRIVDVLHDIRQLLFPGFFGHKELTAENIRYHVGNLLIHAGSELTRQISYCMCADRQCQTCADANACHTEAGDIAQNFLARIPTIRRALALDIQAAFDGDPAAKSTDEVIYCYPGFYAVVVYRIAHELVELEVPLMPRMMSEHAHSTTGADIHPGADIGESFFIDHATGVVVGETTQIGNNVKIYQGVTLGAKSFPKDERGRVIKGLKRHPTIEDNVTIYPNATILGGETVIGQSATVGGNAYIVESVKPGHLVIHQDHELKVLDKNKS
ncbi:MAG: serine acetyltransferase [Phycisphaerae bacterium]|nr:serine acetyltransferase [Phycisphaerae bacterium]